MEKTNDSLTTVSVKEGNSVSVLGDTYRIVIGGDQTNCTYALIDMLIPPRGGLEVNINLVKISLPHSGAILYRFQTLLIQSECIFESRSSP